MLYTKEQVQQQKERFEAFIKNADLSKIGERYVYFVVNDDGRGYNPYNYIHRLLRMVAKVCGAMILPETNQFYSELLITKSVDAFLNKQQKKTE